jgi:tRNA 2-thiouridine synthesizing protein E
MLFITAEGTQFELDEQGFLRDPFTWNESYATALAPHVGIHAPLTHAHWVVIRYIRARFEKSGFCPLLYFTCRENGLTVADLQGLFPTGYLRGACRLAGITYREGYLCNPCSARCDAWQSPGPSIGEKAYGVDVRGFLIDANEWDESFARHRAVDMQMKDGLTARHWDVLHFLRNRFAESGNVPTIFELCDGLSLDLQELERLFPLGYHRGAVKLAGLRVR